MNSLRPSSLPQSFLLLSFLLLSFLLQARFRPRKQGPRELRLLRPPAGTRPFPPPPLLRLRWLPRLPFLPDPPRLRLHPRTERRPRRFRKTGLRPGRFYPPSFRRSLESPSTAPASCRQVARER